ncbi:UNVERIFIED_CONTAM: hypothetical protein HDU68_006203 [Siphonaria sp. JEL0065]|nr:hypothetical protein HDU68_006203 [Siphonaria sp. JEL0065]
MTILSIVTQAFCHPHWVPETGLPDLHGKVALITGASSGLGKETAIQLAAKGAHVFCLGRSAEKCKAAVDEIAYTTKNQNVEFLQCDLMDLASVERAANEFLDRKLPLHILVLNAGIMETPWGLSKQGIESQFATNHFAHVALTSKLLPILESSQPSRIVVLASYSHDINMKLVPGGIKYDQLNNQEKYNAYIRYGESKIANIHFTRELQARLDAKYGGPNACKIYVNCVHPGLVKTELTKDMNQAAVLAAQPIMISPAKGAINQLFLAGAKEVEENNLKGKYIVPYCQVAEPSAEAADKGQAVKTWVWTEKVMKEQYREDWTFGI